MAIDLWTTYIFDLDDTLIDTSRLLIPIQGTPEFFERICKPLPLMPDAESLLISLKEQSRLVLITQGDPLVQKQKILSANLHKYFTDIYIANTAVQETKAHYFKQVLSSLSASSTLAVGNRRSTDLRPAKSLGATTCWFHHGEYLDEPNLTIEDRPDFVVYSHHELRTLCLR